MVSVATFIEFVYIQDLSEKMLKFMRDNFGKVKILESFQSFFRFKVEDNTNLSKMFGQMERNVSQPLIFHFSNFLIEKFLFCEGIFDQADLD